MTAPSGSDPYARRRDNDKERSRMSESIRAEELVEPLSRYSDAIRSQGFLFVSGCVALDGAGNIVGAGDFVAQARQVLENLGAVLRAGGADFGDVLKLTIYLTDIDDRPPLTELRREFFGEHRPASTLVEVSALALPELVVEIEAVAEVPSR